MHNRNTCFIQSIKLNDKRQVAGSFVCFSKVVKHEEEVHSLMTTLTDVKHRSGFIKELVKF